MKTNKNLFHLYIVIAIFLFAGPNLVNASVEDKIKKTVDQAADSIKSAVDSIGNDISAVQNYFDNYHWKGIMQEEATSGVATLRNLHLNGHGVAVAVKPGERIVGEVDCSIDREACSSLGYYRVVIGIHNRGGQTTIGNSVGLSAGESHEQFVLIAPSEPGLYQIRFQTVDAYFESSALSEWNDPDGTTTIGLILVK